MGLSSFLVALCALGFSCHQCEQHETFWQELGAISALSLFKPCTGSARYLIPGNDCRRFMPITAFCLKSWVYTLNIVCEWSRSSCNQDWWRGVIWFGSKLTLKSEKLHPVICLLFFIPVKQNIPVFKGNGQWHSYIRAVVQIWMTRQLSGVYINTWCNIYLYICPWVKMNREMNDVQHDTSSFWQQISPKCWGKSFWGKDWCSHSVVLKEN